MRQSMDNSNNNVKKLKKKWKQEKKQVRPFKSHQMRNQILNGFNHGKTY